MNYENIGSAARFGGSIGMFGCYLASLSGMLDLTSHLNIVGWIVISIAVLAFVGALGGFFIEKLKKIGEHESL